MIKENVINDSNINIHNSIIGLKDKNSQKFIKFFSNKRIEI